MRHLPPKLLEEIYFKTIIPRVTCSISVWGSCPPATFAHFEGLHLKAAKLIHRLPKHIMVCDISQYVHWQNLGHIYKRKIAIKMFKVQLTPKSFFHLTYSPHCPDHLCEKIAAFFNFFFMNFQIWKISRFYDPRPGVKGEWA